MDLHQTDGQKGRGERLGYEGPWWWLRSSSIPFNKCLRKESGEVQIILDLGYLLIHNETLRDGTQV